MDEKSIGETSKADSENSPKEFLKGNHNQLFERERGGRGEFSKKNGLASTSSGDHEGRFCEPPVLDEDEAVEREK